MSVDELVSAARRGNRRALGRLLSLVENDAPEVADLILTPNQPTHVVGVTGSPGVGKSTVTTALISEIRRSGRSVAVLAVDPSSPFTGGAILGDRVRMQEHAHDDGVYVRSMASRGHLGGLAGATPAAIRILEAIGFDVVIVETVGVGQSEVEIAGAADSTVVVVAPGMGDGIQAVKAGIVEIADIFVVNKADRDGADTTVRDLRHSLSLSDVESGEDDWQIPIHKVIATKAQGIDQLLAALDEHRDWLESTGTLQTRRIRRMAEEIRSVALGQLRQQMLDADKANALAQQVLSGQINTRVAAQELRSALT